MAEQGIVLVGGPDSGKTNFLARFWKAMTSRKGVLVAPSVPADIKIVEDALEHLLQGRFAPRSDKNFNDAPKNFTIPVWQAQAAEGQQPVSIVVPDVTGELWRAAVDSYEMPTHWLDQLKTAKGALLFVRVGSELNVDPLDWVNSARLMRMSKAEAAKEHRIPTQVALCEMLRFLEEALDANDKRARPRLAVLVTAWDRLNDADSAGGPSVFLKKQFPFFAGRLADADRIDVKVFGVSVVGGDFTEDAFRDKFLQGDVTTFGYVVTEDGGNIQVKNDLTLPIAWVAFGAN